jgi:hypothetical protein
MSAFDLNEKDDVVEAIKNLAEFESNRGKTPREILQSIMEAVNYSIDSVMYDLRNERVD